MCVIVSKEVDNKFILAKNRDRAYEPVIEIVHEILDGVEVAYLHDVTTDWSEGLNEFGIGIVNSALMVGRDEYEKKIVKKSGKPSKDGIKIRRALTQKTLKSAIKFAVQFNGGIKGHTFVSSPLYMVSIESTSKHTPHIELQNAENPVVRTNHGHIFSDAGYRTGIKYLSSKMRKISAENILDSVTNWKDISKMMRKQFFKPNSQLNMRRDTKTMWTSSQMVLNLTDRIMEITYFEDKIKEFKGIKRNLPDGYEPKIQIIVQKVKSK
jgi:hypothetical protein